MESDNEESSQRELMTAAVVQKLKGIGAISVNHFLNIDPQAPFPTSIECSPDGNNEQRLPDADDSSGSSSKKATSMQRSKPSSSSPEHASSVVEMDEFTRQIEECCMEWRAGRVKPYWLVIHEPKYGRST